MLRNWSNVFVELNFIKNEAKFHDISIGKGKLIANTQTHTHTNIQLIDFFARLKPKIIPRCLLVVGRVQWAKPFSSLSYEIVFYPNTEYLLGQIINFSINDTNSWDTDVILIDLFVNQRLTANESLMGNTL